MPVSLTLSDWSIIFAIQDFYFNPSASPFLPTTCLSFPSSRLTAMHAETSTMTAQLPYIQPGWSQAQYSQSSWSGVYQPQPPHSFHQFGSTAYYAAEEADAGRAGLEQQENASCHMDWYLDGTGNPQMLQSLPSFQVLFRLL